MKLFPKAASGQKLKARSEHIQSGLPSGADVVAAYRHFQKVPILLQKSKVAGLKILGENTTQRAIADSSDLNRVTVAACEFCVRP
jgi:hypothetical protein